MNKGILLPLLLILLLGCDLDPEVIIIEEEFSIDYFYQLPTWIIGSYSNISGAVNFIFTTNNIVLNLPNAKLGYRDIDFNNKYNNELYNIQVVYSDYMYSIRINEIIEDGDEIYYKFIISENVINYYSEVNGWMSGPITLNNGD